MKKLLKTTVAALAVLTSACALASCGGGKDDTSDDPVISAPSTNPDDNNTEDNQSTDNGPDTDPDTGNGENTGTDSESSDSTSTDTSTEDSNTETETETETTDPKDYYSFDESLISLNIKKEETMPEEGTYDIYAYYTTGSVSAWAKAKDGQFKLGKDVDEVWISLVKKDKEPTESGNVLITIKNITIAGQNLVFEVTEKEDEGQLVEYTYNAETLIYNFRNSNLKEKYDTYVYYWYAEGLDAWAKADNGKVMLDSRVDGAIIVAAKVGSVPSWSEEGKLNILTQTENLTIAGNVIELELGKPAEREIILDPELIQYNLAKDNVMPTVPYDIYVYLHDERLSDKYIKIVDNKFMADERYTLAVIILVNKDEPIDGFNNALAKTTDCIIEGTNIIFNEDKPLPYEPVYITYSFNRNELAWNLKNGKVLPSEYDLYLHAWGEGVEAIDVLVNGNEVLLDSRYTGAHFVLVGKGNKPTLDYNKGCLARTTNLTFGGDNKLLFNINEDPFTDNIEFTCNPRDIERNLANGATMPQGEYDIYLYWCVVEGYDGFYHVTANTVNLPAGTSVAKFVLVKPGMDAAWDNDSKLAETVDAIITKEHKITFENPAPEDVEMTVNVEDLLFNLAKGSLRVSGEYTLYAHAYKDAATGNDFLVTDGKFTCPSDYNKVIFLFMKPGSKPAFSGEGYLAKTNVLEINNKVVETPNKKVDYIDYTYSLDDIPYNLKDLKKMPADGSYNLYLHYWSTDEAIDEFVLVDSDIIKLTANITGAQFVLCSKDSYPTTSYDSGCLAMTENVTLEDKLVKLPTKAPAKTHVIFDTNLIQYNIKGDKTMPEAGTYDIFVYLFTDDKKNNESFKLEGNSFNTTVNYTNILFVLVKKGTPDLVWEGDNFILQTEDLKLKDNNGVGSVIFTNPKPADKIYTFDLNDVIWNLIDNKFAYTDEYDIYLHYTGKNVDSHVLLEGNTLTLDDRITALEFVVVEKNHEYTLDYQNGCIGKTASINGADKDIKLPIKATNKVEISYDEALIQYNLVEGNKIPTGTNGVDFDIYIKLYSDNDYIYRYINTNDLKLNSFAYFTKATIIYVAHGYTGNLNDAEVLAKTLELKCNNGAIEFVNQAPVELEASYDLKDIPWNLKDSKELTDSNYDVYLHYWGLNYDGNIKLDGTNVKFDSRAAHFEFVVVKKDNPYTTDYDNGCLGITVEASLNEANKLVLPEAAPKEIALKVFDKNLIKYNLMEGMSLNEAEYDIIIRFKTNSGVTKDYIYTGEAFNIYESFTSATIYAVKKGEASIKPEVVYANTFDLKVVAGEIQFKYQLPKEKIYTFTLADVIWNIGDNYIHNDQYKIFIHYWGYNLDEYKQVDGLDSVTLDDRVNGLQFVVTKKDSGYTTDMDNGCLGITKDFDGALTAIVFDNKAPEARDYTFNLDLLKYNMSLDQEHPKGVLGVDYDIYAHLYFSETGWYDYKLTDNTIHTNNKYNKVIFLFVAKGKNPIFDKESTDYIAQTLEINITDSIQFEYQIPTEKTYTFNTKEVIWNLANDTFIYEEKYNIYLRYWGYNYEDVALVNDLSELKLDSRVNFLQFVICKGDFTFETGFLGKTDDIDGKETAISFANKEPKDISITIDRELLKYNIKSGCKPVEGVQGKDYNIYVRVFIKGTSYFKDIPLNSDTILTTDNITNCVFAFVKPDGGDIFGDGLITQTIDLDVVDGQIVFPNKKPVINKVTIDTTLYKYNIEKGKMPTGDYDVYAHAFNDNNEEYDYFVTGNELNIDEKYTKVIFVFVNGNKFTWNEAEGWIGQTFAAEVTKNSIKFQFNAPKEIEHTISLDNLVHNLKNDQALPQVKYDSYLHVWGNGIDKFIKITGTTVKFDNRVTGGQVVLVNEGEIPTTQNSSSWLNLTYDVVITENTVELKYKAVEYTINFDNLKLNMKDNKPLPTENFKIYAYLYSDIKDDNRNVEVVNNKFSVTSRYNHCIIVYVKKNAEGFTWDSSAGFLAQSVDLALDKEILYPQSEGLITITADPSKYANNLAGYAKLPTEEYDIYAHIFKSYNNSDSKDIKLVNNSFEADGSYDRVVLVFVKKGSAMTWNTDQGFLVKSNDLTIAFGKVQLK